MKIFKEYYLDISTVGVQTLYLPLAAKVVSANYNASVVLSVLQDLNEQNTSLRKFKICTKCENIYEDTVKYIDTITTDYGTRYIIEVL